YRLLAGGALPGRRPSAFEARFLAPFPATRHSDVRAELAADVLDVVGTVVPALRWNATNLREHGGYVVVASVRVGWLARRLVTPVLVSHLGDGRHVGGPGRPGGRGPPRGGAARLSPAARAASGARACRRARPPARR